MDYREILRRAQKKTVRHYQYGSVATFLSSSRIKSGIHSCDHRSLPLEFFVRKRHSDTLLVVFHAAKPKNIELPWFSGGRIAAKLGVTHLAFSDPSLCLDDELSIGWHIGNRYQPDYQDKVVQIVRNVAEKTKTRQIIFFGGSAGGFASLVFSHAFAGSYAVVMNPQTDASQYYGDPWNKYLDIAWNTNDRAQLPHSVVYSTISLYQNSGHNNVIYMQNNTDSFHIKNHLTPLMNVIDENHMKVIEGEWGQGHLPPPHNIIFKVLKSIIHKGS